MLSGTVTALWDGLFHGGEVVAADGLQIAVNDGLREDRRVMVLTRADGRVEVALTPAVAAQLPGPLAALTVAELHRQLAAAGLALNGANHLFYYVPGEAERVRVEPLPAPVRLLTPADGPAFAAFQAGASEQDLDDAYVELDHWAVVGAFDGDDLVSVASMYPWDDTRLADLGVLTLPGVRGRGHARRIVRAISAHALGRGYETQYRCQLDNAASVALAASAGLTLFGTWDVIAPDAG